VDNSHAARARSRLSVFALVPAWLWAAGCGGEQDVAVGVSFAVQDSGGVEIVVNGSPLWSTSSGWSVGSEPALVLGPEPAPGRFLNQVKNIERLVDGRIVVENKGSSELLVFDSAGTFLDAWGGRGDGPGEFSQAFRLFRCGEDLLAEVERRRVSFFDSQGRFLRTARVPSALFNAQAFGIGADCGSIFAVGVVRADEPTGFGTHHHPDQALWASLDGPSVDTLGTFPGPEWLADSSGRETFLVPFPYAPNWATDGKVVYYGWGDRAEIEVLAPDGGLMRLIRWSAPPSPITDADWAAYEADLEAERATQPRQASVLLSDRDEHPHPDVKPYFGPPHVPDARGSAFLLDDEGHLWVRRFTRTLATNRDRSPPGPPRWWVFDPSGRWLGEVQTPQGLVVKNVRGGFLLGVFRGELGAEEVHAYRIEVPHA